MRQLLACLLVFGWATSPAQEVINGSWSRVMDLAPDSAVKVVNTARKSVKGRVVSADDASLVIRRNNGDEKRFLRDEVREVKKRNMRTRLKNAGIGAAAGAGAGAAISGAALFSQGGSEAVPIIMGLATGGCALAGFGVGLLTPSYGTIYKIKG